MTIYVVQNDLLDGCKIVVHSHNSGHEGPQSSTSLPVKRKSHACEVGPQEHPPDTVVPYGKESVSLWKWMILLKLDLS